MMSAQPSRAISSRMAGVSTLAGIRCHRTTPPDRPTSPGPKPRVPAEAGRTQRDLIGATTQSPVPAAGMVAAVGRLVDQLRKPWACQVRAERADGRPNERRDPNELAGLERAVEQALALEERQIDQAVDPSISNRSTATNAMGRSGSRWRFGLGRSGAAADEHLGQELRRLFGGSIAVRSEAPRVLGRLDRQVAVQDELVGQRRGGDGLGYPGELRGAVDARLRRSGSWRATRRARGRRER